MFTCSVEEVNFYDEIYYNLSLDYVDDSFRISFTCEEQGKISLAEEGQINHFPSNGEHYFTWNKEKFFFMVAKYGGGDGGSLTIEIKNTPQLSASFAVARAKWNKYAENI